MNKGKTARIAGFVGALGVSAVLVTTAIQGTGAWFTDSADGTIAASSGHLTLDTGSSNLALNYADLMPGANVDKTISYNVSVSSGTVDLWLTFDDDAAYQTFTGGLNSPLAPGGGMGGYGYFSVADSVGGTAFTSGNLAFPPYGESNNQPNTTATNSGSHNGTSCSTDPSSNRGGSSEIATASNPIVSKYCGVPSKILLRSGMASGAGGTVTVTFGLDGFKQTQQNQQQFGPDNSHAGYVGYHLVATQHNQQP